MGSFYNAFNMCLSMFTIIPTPKYDWDEDNRDMMLRFLPIVGLIIGGLWYIIYFLLSLVHIHNFNYIFTFFISIFPIVISGFIHVDGFMDIVDSICSCRDITKRKKILKDPDVGSFAVIFFVLSSIMNYISMYSIIINHSYMYFIILIFIPYFSRIMSCIGLKRYEKINVSEYIDINDKKDIKYYIVLMILGLLLVSFVNIKFLFIIIIEIICHFLCMLFCYKNLKGVNGDASGFSIYVSESISILCMAIIFNI